MGRYVSLKLVEATEAEVLITECCKQFASGKYILPVLAVSSV